MFSRRQRCGGQKQSTWLRKEKTQWDTGAGRYGNPVCEPTGMAHNVGDRDTVRELTGENVRLRSTKQLQQSIKRATVPGHEGPLKECECPSGAFLRKWVSHWPLENMEEFMLAQPASPACPGRHNN